MLGDDRLFEKLVQEGEKIESDSGKNVDEKEVKEVQEPFTKEEIQQSIQNLEDKLLNMAGGRTADRQTEVVNQWEDEIERLEALLADAPSDEEVEAAVDELLSRLRVQFGGEFVFAITSSDPA